MNSHVNPLTILNNSGCFHIAVRNVALDGNHIDRWWYMVSSTCVLCMCVALSRYCSLLGCGRRQMSLVSDANTVSVLLSVSSRGSIKRPVLVHLLPWSITHTLYRTVTPIWNFVNCTLHPASSHSLTTGIRETISRKGLMWHLRAALGSYGTQSSCIYGECTSPPSGSVTEIGCFSIIYFTYWYPRDHQ